MSPSEGAGIVVAYSYFENLDTPESKSFISGFKKRFPEAGGVADTPAQVWNAWHQWKAAVELAGSTEIDAVVDRLRKGLLPLTGLRARSSWTRHATEIFRTFIWRVTTNQTYEIIEKSEQVMPTREVIGAGACDLVGKDDKSHKMINPQF